MQVFPNTGSCCKGSKQPADDPVPSTMSMPTCTTLVEPLRPPGPSHFLFASDLPASAPAPGTLLVLSPSEVGVHDREFHYVVRLSLRFTPRDHQRDVILRFAAAELLDRRYDRLQKRWHRQMVMGSQGLKQAALAKLLAVRAAASVTPSVYSTKISPGESCTSTTSHRQSSNRPGRRRWLRTVQPPHP